SPDRWHDADDLLELVQQLVEDVDTEPFRLSRPLLAFTLYGMDQSPEWWLVERAQPDARLDLDSPEVQDRYYQTLTRALLTGPLAWLGVVDVAERGPGDLAFRVQPGALALLIGDALAEEASPTAEASEILIDDDLAILVPSRTTDAEVYRLLGEIGEFTGITRDGLRYRLTAERAQQLFDAGMTGPRLVEHLTRHARQLPREARARIERWWSSYGAVQLYDDLTLIELGDDYLLPELLATTSLDQALIHTFSPRLIAVDSRAAEALRAELERLGHTPRLVEGG
ncbi:MAG TPA: helicase-associated domain-containing protein, partial [Chloroflexota bacterium]|nr:helicase-associated domain-containing protein [Chloroflexota bacterium]